MACRHWLFSDERMIFGYAREEAMPHTVESTASVEDEIFAFLDGDSASGLWHYAFLGENHFQFRFSDPNTAFEFKLRFG